MTDQEIRNEYNKMYKRITEVLNRYPGNVPQDVQEKMFQRYIESLSLDTKEIAQGGSKLADEDVEKLRKELEGKTELEQRAILKKWTFLQFLKENNIAPADEEVVKSLVDYGILSA